MQKADFVMMLKRFGHVEEMPNGSKQVKMNLDEIAGELEQLFLKHHVSGWQDVTDIHKLNRGDIVRNKQSLNSYVVEANYGNRVTAICSVDITNAQEWEVLPAFS